MLASFFCFMNFSIFPNLEAARGAMILLFMSTGGSMAGCRDFRMLDEIMAAKSYEELKRIFDENFTYDLGHAETEDMQPVYAYDNVFIYKKKHGPQKPVRYFKYELGKTVEVKV